MLKGTVKWFNKEKGPETGQTRSRHRIPCNIGPCPAPGCSQPNQSPPGSGKKCM